MKFSTKHPRPGHCNGNSIVVGGVPIAPNHGNMGHCDSEGFKDDSHWVNGPGNLGYGRIYPSLNICTTYNYGPGTDTFSAYSFLQYPNNSASIQLFNGVGGTTNFIGATTHSIFNELKNKNNTDFELLRTQSFQALLNIHLEDSSSHGIDYEFSKHQSNIEDYDTSNPTNTSPLFINTSNNSYNKNLNRKIGELKGSGSDFNTNYDWPNPGGPDPAQYFMGREPHSITSGLVGQESSSKNFKVALISSSEGNFPNEYEFNLKMLMTASRSNRGDEVYGGSDAEFSIPGVPGIRIVEDLHPINPDEENFYSYDMNLQPAGGGGGTSTAGPVVAGALTLYKQINPNATVLDARRFLNYHDAKVGRDQGADAEILYYAHLSASNLDTNNPQFSDPRYSNYKDGAVSGSITNLRDDGNPILRFPFNSGFKREYSGPLNFKKK